MTEENQTKKGKTYLTVSSDVLARLQEQTGMQPAAIGEALGVTASCISTWLREGKMSKLGSVAAEGLLRRSISLRPEVTVALVPKARVETFRDLCRALDIALINVPTD